MHGKGVYKSANGNVYEGDFVNNEKSGQGKMHYKGVGIYIGQWTANKKQGNGKFTWDNGNEYSGAFSNDKANGKGVFKYKSSGDVYDGGNAQAKSDSCIHRHSQNSQSYCTCCRNDG